MAESILSVTTAQRRRIATSMATIEIFKHFCGKNVDKGEANVWAKVTPNEEGGSTQGPLMCNKGAITRLNFHGYVKAVPVSDAADLLKLGKPCFEVGKAVCIICIVTAS